MDNVDMARESMEHAHGHHEAADPWTMRAALLVAILAAFAVVGEMSGNDAQMAYLSAHITASDEWTQYQAKSVRRALYSEMAMMLTGPAADQAKQDAARMQSQPGGDGMQQLAERAHEQEKIRSEELHRHAGVERGVRGLQIAIVLTSLFMVTKMRWLLGIGFVLGVVSAVYAGWAAVL